MSSDQSTAEQLSREFSRIVAEWCGANTGEIVLRNIAEKNPNICHSHDFCDANQAMIDACENLGLDHECGANPIVVEAWEIAKSMHFYTES